jgi:hypothetical protein
MGGAKALFKKDDMVQAYRIRSEERGWVMSAGKQKSTSPNAYTYRYSEMSFWGPKKVKKPINNVV